MKDRTGVRIVCPYCGNEAVYFVKEGKQIILCDIEDTPGCDRYFVADMRFVPKVKLYAMVEQEGER